MLITGAAQDEARIKGLRLGFDLTRTALQYLEPKREAFEISADFELKQNFYLTAEFGQQAINWEFNTYDYSSVGKYLRLGIDNNFSKNKKDINAYEMVFGGLRYGFSNYSHRASNMVIPINYWGTEIPNSIQEMQMSAHWVEVVAGIRGELFKNFFMGWSFHAKLMLWQKKDPLMYTYNIPGYGRGNKKSQLGFNYSLYYRIPLYKVKKDDGAVKEP